MIVSKIWIYEIWFVEQDMFCLKWHVIPPRVEDQLYSSSGHETVNSTWELNRLRLIAVELAAVMIYIKYKV